MKLAATLLFILFLFFNVQTISAAAKKTAPSGNLSVSPSYNKTKKAVIVNFGNLGNTKKVSYTLLYNGNGIGQGVMGSITPGKNKTVSRTLLLGTCSKKVCTYHKNVKNIQLEVSAQYKNGKRFQKTYKVK